MLTGRDASQTFCIIILFLFFTFDLNNIAHSQSVILPGIDTTSRLQKTHAHENGATWEDFQQVRLSISRISKESTIPVAGVYATAREFSILSGIDTRLRQSRALDVGIMLVKPFEQASFMAALGAAGMQNGLSKAMMEGGIFASLRSSPSLDWIAHFVWEGDPKSSLPIFIYAGAKWRPTSLFALEIILPSRIEGSLILSSMFTIRSFAKTARESETTFSNAGLFPEGESHLIIQRKGWKLGVGIDARAAHGQLYLDYGVVVAQQARIRDRKRELKTTTLPNAPFVEFGLRWPK